MKNDNNQKPVPNLNSATKSLQVTEENQREFVRFELSTSIKIYPLKDVSGNFHQEDDQVATNGSLLNLSEGGLLIETEDQISEGDIVFMTLEIKDVSEIKNILGKVKRVDREDKTSIIGIELTSKDDLVDDLSQAELDLMGDRFSHFRDAIKSLLGNHVPTENNQRVSS